MPTNPTIGSSQFTAPYDILPNILYTNPTLAAGPTLSSLTAVVLPNPTNGLLNIKGVNNCTIEIYNSVGQMVKNINSLTENLKINLSDFTSGQYIFKIISNNETVIKTISIL